MADVPHVAAGLASTFPVVVAEESGRGRLPRLQGQLPLRSSEPHLGSRGHPSSRQCSGELVSKPRQHPPPPDPGPQTPRRGPSLLGVTSGPTTPEARESKCLHRFRPRAPLDPANRRRRVPRALTDEAFVRLVFKALAQAATEGLHVEAFEEGPGAEFRDGSRVPDLPLIGDPERWLMMHFGIPGLWVTLRDPEAAASELAAGLRVWLDDRELLLSWRCLRSGIEKSLHGSIVTRTVGLTGPAAPRVRPDCGS